MLGRREGISLARVFFVLRRMYLLIKYSFLCACVCRGDFGPSVSESEISAFVECTVCNIRGGPKSLPVLKVEFEFRK